jgi:hypothetical protein
MSKDTGLEVKYAIYKVDPNASGTFQYEQSKRSVEGIVLEWDDPIARVGIKAWAEAMLYMGYTKVYRDVIEKLKVYEK